MSLNMYWGIVDLQHLIVSGVEQSDSVIHVFFHF